MAKRMTREEATEALRKLAPELAAELGGVLVEAPTGENTHRAVIAKDGYEVNLWAGYVGGGFGSVRIMACLPCYPNTNRHPWLGANVSDPKISCSLTRPAKQIAAEVTRRLLPEYLPLRARALEIVSENTQHETQIAAAAAKLADVVGLPHSQIADGTVGFYHSSKLRESIGEARVSGDSVELRLPSLSFDEAKRLLEVLVDFRAPVGEVLAR